MASEQADLMVQEMANFLKKRRTSMKISMNALSVSSGLDRAALHRAESGDRIPSLPFWVDWADTLGSSLEEVVAESRKVVKKPAGKPPKRKPLF